MSARLSRLIPTKNPYSSTPNCSPAIICGSSRPMAWTVCIRRFSVSQSLNPVSMGILNNMVPMASRKIPLMQVRYVSTKQRRRWKIRKYHFKLRLKRTMRKMRVPYMSSKSRGQVKKKPILYDFRPYLRRKLKRAER